MKKRIAFLLAFVLLFSLAGCGSKPQTPPETTPVAATPETTISQTEPPVETVSPVETESAVMQQKPVTAVTVPMHTQSSYAEDGTEIFRYSYQSISLLVQEPEVADKVIVDFLNRVDPVAAAAEELAASASSNYTASDYWIPYLCRLLYEPTRIDEGVLSLFGTHTIYSGGMHPDHLNVSANYDLITGDVLTLGSIMHKDASLEGFCQLVLQELERKADELYLFEDYPKAVEKRFATDESKDEAFFFTGEGLCFYFSPYEIAPYASGTIIAEIPYEKLVGLLHEAYFPAERVYADGKLTITPFEKADLDSVSQISEAILTSGGQMHLLTSESSLQNIRVILTSSDPQIHEYCFFAASQLNPGDGIMIEATAEELENILITYETSAGLQTLSPVF